PAIISIFLGSQLNHVFEAIEQGESSSGVSEAVMQLGTTQLPELEKDPGDRNRTSPFAFTGNKFEFRALGSGESPSLPNTVLNTIAAESVTRLTNELQKAIDGGQSVEDAVPGLVLDSWLANKQVVFNGDNYSEEWHAEAERRGLKNLRTTPDALPELVSEQTVAVFEGVLSERELEARFEVMTEQYATKVNIEAETAATIARTQLLPAAVRHLAMLRAAGDGVTAVESLSGEVGEMIEELTYAIRHLEEKNDTPEDLEGLAWAKYIRDEVIPAMDGVREVADRLERIVAEDLWPLPRYSEILFIK
ncbi:MAG: glutamine synthetase, partial [Thermoleophilaceae bacterium]|nr:glutamine synthetase [Thermoleophilaceae bacterium]